jgi:hypothetical protein
MNSQEVAVAISEALDSLYTLSKMECAVGDTDVDLHCVVLNRLDEAWRALLRGLDNGTMMASFSISKQDHEGLKGLSDPLLALQARDRTHDWRSSIATNAGALFRELLAQFGTHRCPRS